MLDGKVYTKNSRFGNEWLREVLYSDIYEYLGISFANNIFVYADIVFGFDVSDNMAGWENLGVETLDGRQLVHFQRTASVNQQLHDLVLRRVMFDLWINERDQLVRHFRAFIETNRVDITLTADIVGYNEPVEFPNPLG